MKFYNMCKRGFALKGLFLIFAVFGLTTSQTATSKCAPKDDLAKEGLVSLATPTTTKDDVYCLKSYTTGYCVEKESLKTKMASMVTFYKGRAMDAVNFAYQLKNATVFFQKANKVITVTTPTTTTDTLSGILDALLDKLKEVVGFFEGSPKWIKDLFTGSIAAVNPCFQAFANITNGAICTITANADMEVAENKPTSLVNLKVDVQSTGAALDNCLPLIDVYCTITHGVSIKVEGDAFNHTLSTDFADGGISKEDCVNLRTNLASKNADAATLRYTDLVNRFQHNYIPFVPSAASILSLGTHYSAAIASKDTKYTVVLQTNTVKGITLQKGTGTVNPNIYDAGKNSGAPAEVYSSKILGAKVILMVIIGFVSRF